MNKPKMYEILLDELMYTEAKAQKPFSEIEKIKWIEIHPRVLHDLLLEQEKELESNKMLFPYIEYVNNNVSKNISFLGIPMYVTTKTDRWEIVI